MLSAVIRSALGYPAFTVGTITGTPESSSLLPLHSRANLRLARGNLCTPPLPLGRPTPHRNCLPETVPRPVGPGTRTVIVTAAVHRGFGRRLPCHQVTNFLDLPALGRRQPPYMVLRLCGDLCFW
ncbi:hypothetical protein VNO80_35352 [Phaseolus coccineus]|uniref:Uncharacterized protein n=1 Tax=Phaseolus coccineus TaxID=3886 RepID=A0AAN9KQE3_PHACN